MRNDPQRRSILLAGLGSAASLLLAGCASSRRAALSGVPGPAWPHERRATPTVAERPDRPPAATGVPAGVRPRGTWTSTQPVLAQANPMGRVERITVHHDALQPITITSPDQAADRIESIRRVHVENNGWADIGYHYIVDPIGGVWEGRPVRLQGAHVQAHNPRNIGVLVLGHFNLQQPTPRALDALDWTLTSLCELHSIPLGSVATHRELSPTECPGDNLQRYMDQTRSRRGRLAQQIA
ncbi:MAG: peptidoglycan recognition protein family protein [Phycisphaerales bacterium]